MKNDIIIYTDGSSLGNPGRGGWGAVVQMDGKVTELGGAEKDTTNNRMEMTAAYEALHFVESKLKTNNSQLITAHIHTDSAYLLKGITKWVFGWEKKDWKTSTGDEVLNQDLWKKLMSVTKKLKVSWTKVKGHSGVHLNECADIICTSFAFGEPVRLHKNMALADFEESCPDPVERAGSKKAVSKVSKSKSSKPGYSYISMIDGMVQVDKTWAECEKRVKGKSGAKYKKSVSKDDENNIIALWSLDSLF